MVVAPELAVAGHAMLLQHAKKNTLALAHAQNP